MERLLTPLSEDVEILEFFHWFATRSGGKELLNKAATGAELAAALTDYASEGYVSERVTSLWYQFHGAKWEAALV
jgi:hypothetical protein